MRRHRIDATRLQARNQSERVRRCSIPHLNAADRSHRTVGLGQQAANTTSTNDQQVCGIRARQERRRQSRRRSRTPRCDFIAIKLRQRYPGARVVQPISGVQAGKPLQAVAGKDVDGLDAQIPARLPGRHDQYRAQRTAIRRIHHVGVAQRHLTAIDEHLPQRPDQRPERQRRARGVTVYQSHSGHP